MTTRPTFKIVYPEPRTVNATLMRSWASDAMANGEIASGLDLDDPRACAEALHESGAITLIHEDT